jgi:hypothetical protein
MKEGLYFSKNEKKYKKIQGIKENREYLQQMLIHENVISAPVLIMLNHTCYSAGSKVKLFLKQGISHKLGRDAGVRFEWENSAIDVIINFL